MGEAEEAAEAGEDVKYSASRREEHGTHSTNYVTHCPNYVTTLRHRRQRLQRL